MRYNGTDVYNNHIIYASPTVAYKILHNLSVGLSLGMGRQEEGGHIQVRVPGVERVVNEAIDIGILRNPGFKVPKGTGYKTDLAHLDFDYDDPVTFSANVGLLWKPADWLAFGLTYRSESHAKMDGRTHVRYSPELRGLLKELGVPDPGSIESFEGNCTQMQPQSVTVGTKIDITDRWRVMVDFQWTDWSVRKYEHWTLDGEPALLQILGGLADQINDAYLPADRINQKRRWKDTKEFRFGTEYDTLDWLSLRLGYSYRPCVVKEKYWENNWPLTDFHIFSFGAGIKVFEQGTLDLAYQFMYGDNWDIEHNESELSNKDLARDKILYSPYYGSDIEESYRIHRVVVTFNYRF
jgi:long-chain fatty acid transport protein